MIGKPWFLSIVAGAIATALYYTMHRKDAEGKPDEPVQRRKQQYRYAFVFIVVAVLVYGSFLAAESAGECKFVEENVEIQTGGRPPF